MKVARTIAAIAFAAALTIPAAAQGTWQRPDDRDRVYQRDNDRDWHRDDDRWRDRDRDRDRNRDWRRDDWRWRDRDRNRDWNRGGYSNMAYRNGYSAGIEEGQRDYYSRRKFKFGSALKKWNHGYRSEFGDKKYYKQQYEQGYIEGYNRGYYGRGGSPQIGTWRR